MRLHILSDLHLEFAHLDLPQVSADVVVVAGDVHKGHRGLEWLRQTFPVSPVVYVLGNHEYYGHALPGLTDELRVAAEGTNVHVLENQEFEFGGVTFLGATLWTDFALDGNPKNGGLIAEKCMNDFRLVSTSPDERPLRAADMRRLHAESVDWLRQRLVALRGRPVVVVTHHLPSARSIASRFSGDPLNPAFASNLDELVAASGAVLWIHGHSHTAADYRVGLTRVLANPRGYPRETESGFAPGLVVDIDPASDGRSSNDTDLKDASAAAGLTLLLNREGGSVTATDAARLFSGGNDSASEALDEATRSGRLIAIRDANNILRYPVWQFGPHGGAVPGLAETLAILAQRTEPDTLSFAAFFLNPSARLKGLSPIQALREGGGEMIATVKRLAAESLE